MDSNTTLVELGMDSLMGVEIKQLIERDYDLDLSTEEVRALSISRLQEISQNGVSDLQSKNGGNSQMNKLIIEIPVECITYLNDVREGRPVLLFPPVEGSFRLLIDLAKHINRPVIGLNWTHDCQHLKTIEETAEYYLNIITDLLKDNSYDLIGYSMGGLFAYEVAVRLQVFFLENYI